MPTTCAAQEMETEFTKFPVTRVSSACEVLCVFLAPSRAPCMSASGVYPHQKAERDSFCLGDLRTGGGIEFALNDEELVPRKGRGVGAETSRQRKQRGKACGEGKTVGCLQK